MMSKILKVKNREALKGAIDLGIAMQLTNIARDVCEDNPIAQQFALGTDLGVKGTPALITEAGVLLPGYMPADKLARALGL